MTNEQLNQPPRIPAWIADQWIGGWLPLPERKPKRPCIYCHGSGKAPGSGSTACGFCDTNTQEKK